MAITELPPAGHVPRVRVLDGVKGNVNGVVDVALAVALVLAELNLVKFHVINLQ